jgi:hypothetical protein
VSVLMVDGTAADVPAIKARFGQGTPVAGYVTGGWPVEWSEPQFAEFTRKIRIAQSFDLGTDDATTARTLDVETGAATPEDWPAFYESRASKERATCYCDLSNVQSVLDACFEAEIPDPPRFWLPWYWGRPGAPTDLQVLEALRELAGDSAAHRVAGHLWAVQYANYAQWDLSAVYGTPDFSRR